jgi:hypothetical protein
MRSRFTSVCCFLWLFLFLCQSSRCLAQEIKLEELAQAAHAIAIGTIERKDFRQLPQEDSLPLVYTLYTLSVERYLKNDLKKPTVLIFCEGGMFNDETLVSAREPVFSEGEKCLVFLARQRRDMDAYPVEGGREGKLTIEDGEIRDCSIFRDCAEYPQIKLVDSDRDIVYSKFPMEEAVAQIDAVLQPK